MEWSSLSSILASLAVLTFLEIVLGVDNLIFISIACNRLPHEQQRRARQIGLALAWITRLLLLASVIWLTKLTKPLFSLFGHPFSGRDLFLIAGGLFLLYKSTFEIHTEFDEEQVEDDAQRVYPSFKMVVSQVVMLDIIFSLDSIFTAVGITQQFWIMATAITIAVILMIFASEPLSKFVLQKPTIKMLALSFLLLIGTVLIADGFGFHIPRQYIYFALSFSVLVETLNLLLANRRKKMRAQKIV